MERKFINCYSYLWTSLKKKKLTNFMLVFSFLISSMSFQLNANLPGSKVLAEMGVKAVQQEKVIKGRVLDGVTNLPMPGANVSIEGTNIGGITDAEGNFSLTYTKEEAVLVISFIGYETVKVSIGDQQSIEISLKQDLKNLEEVVVVGYGAAKKMNLTSSVSVVKGNEIKEVPVNNVTNALAGKMTGLISRSWSGEPGADNAQLLVRGVSTTGDNSPLYVVDGIPNRDITAVDMNDIESVTVLKDASAVAPYGSRGANGVIMVTTKRGKTGKPVFSYSTYYGIQQPTKLPEFCNSADFAILQNEAYENENKPKPWTDEDIQKFRDGTDPNYPNTDWFKEILNKNALQTRHNLGVTGGNESVRYYFSLGAFGQDGFWSNTDYKKYNFRSNVDVDLSKNFKLIFDLAGFSSDKHSPVAGTWQFMEYPMRVAPVFPVKNADGQYVAAAAGTNPAADLALSGYDRNLDNGFQGSLSGELKIPFVDGLKIKGVAVIDKNYGSEKLFDTPYSLWYMVNRSTGIYEERKPLTGPRLYQKSFQDMKTVLELHLNYTKTIGDHQITGLFVYTQSQAKGDYIDGQRIDFLSRQIDQLFAGPALNQSVNGTAWERGTLGMVGRITYNYKSKYLFESNCRYDGSDIFPENKRYGFFPSFAVGWRISEEGFIKNNVSFLDNLKLRASWGKAGNDRVDPYQYLGTYGFYESPYSFGNQLVQTSYEARLPNPNITWENATLSDFGFETTLLNGLITAEVDYFYKKTTDILAPSGKASSIIGIAMPDENIGKVENKGFEFQLGHRKSFGDFKYSLVFNYTYTKNKALELGEAEGLLNDPLRSRTNKPLGQYFGRLSDGLFVSPEEVTERYKTIKQSGMKPGDIKYLDINGPEGVPDGIINSYDETSIGYSNIPEIIYGFTLNASYKGIDLSIFFQGADHVSYMYSSYGANAFDNGGKIMIWQKDNRFNINTNPDPNAKYPRLTTAPTANNTALSDYWLRDNAYLRLKTVQIGYNFKKTLLQKIGIKDLRIYVSGQNLFTTVRSEISYLDPESGDTRGNFYPQVKVYTAGLNVSF